MGGCAPATSPHETQMGITGSKGRKKQVIIRAGSNISPQEVEEALYLHPAVLEAGAVGAPDELYGRLASWNVQLLERSAILKRIKF